MRLRSAMAGGVRSVWGLLAWASLAVAFAPAPAQAGWCWEYSDLAANDPRPWGCSSTDDGISTGDTVGQTVRQEHRNWHCTHTVPSVISDPVEDQRLYGREFCAFHRQFIQDMRELVEMASNGEVKSHIGRSGPLSELDTIFDELQKGQYLGRAVLTDMGS